MTVPDAERWTEPVYLDASALVKFSVPEPESDDLNQALAGLTDVIVSDLAFTEVASRSGRGSANNASAAKKHSVCIEKPRSCTPRPAMPN